MAANYTALIAAWNGATQPPTGTVGTAITGGMWLRLTLPAGTTAYKGTADIRTTGSTT